MSKILSQITFLLFIFANLNPVLAVSKSQNTEYPEKSLQILVAGFLTDINRTLGDVRQTVEEVEQTVETITKPQREQRERQALEEEKRRQQEEIEAARQADAEKREQYFNTLSPEEQQAYIEQRQKLEQQQAEASLRIMELWAQFLLSGDGSGSTQQTPDYYYREDNTPAPSYEPAPTVEPINPFYGDCHSYDC